MAAAINTTPIAGVFLGANDSTPTVGVGTVVNLNDGGQAMYVKALSEISTYACVLIDSSSVARMSTTALGVTIKRVGFAQTSIASAFYGWVQLGGSPLVNCAANCAPNVPLYLTSTVGVLDDATVSAAMVAGVTAQNTISNATAVTIVAGYPHISFQGGV
jgi:hypothetical protein